MVTKDTTFFPAGMGCASLTGTSTMNAISEKSAPTENEDFVEVDRFSESLAPVNHQKKLLFGLKDRLCCVSVLATFFALMRLFLSK